jgi:hypothetical protein
MNALLPKFQTCLLRTHEAGFHPCYRSCADKQIQVFDYLWLIGLKVSHHKQSSCSHNRLFLWGKYKKKMVSVNYRMPPTGNPFSGTRVNGSADAIQECLLCETASNDGMDTAE